MAVGKNKRLTKGKKGGKKKASDPFLKKEMYFIKAPSMFLTRNAGKTIITRTQGNSKCFLYFISLIFIHFYFSKFCGGGKDGGGRAGCPFSPNTRITY